MPGGNDFDIYALKLLDYHLESLGAKAKCCGRNRAVCGKRRKSETVEALEEQ